jgi:hypothetical protein
MALEKGLLTRESKLPLHSPIDTDDLAAKVLTRKCHLKLADI